MTVLLGSRDGVYRLSLTTPDDLECVLDDVEVYGLAGTASEVYVAAVEGFYYSGDGCRSWREIPLSARRVTSVVMSPSGDTVYAGTMPPRIYRSESDGTWTELVGFQELPSREKWYNRDVDIHVRSLAVDPSVPGRLIAGIDGGGVHVSDDHGETWNERMMGLPQYVHEILVCGPNEYIAATDAGLYRTDDGGLWWDFLHDDDLKHRYFRGAVQRGRTVYAGGARSHPPTWWKEGGADAALYELDFSENDRRPRITAVSYPGEPDELPLKGVRHDERVVMSTSEGRVMSQSGAGDWETVVVLPGCPGIRALHRL